jgi:hypothetical protein
VKTLLQSLGQKPTFGERRVLAQSGRSQKTTTSLIRAITLFGLWPANGEGTTEALYLLVAAVAAYFLFRLRTWRSSGKHNDPIP